MPFSNQREEGFENRIATLLAEELGAPLEYTWWAQRRGYIRNTINEGLCDLYIGVPATTEMLLVTKPYYRSTYVFVYRKSAGVRIESLNSPMLRKLRIGVQIVGDDYANTPPAHALGRRGIIENVKGYSVLGDYSQPNPPARIIEAVARNEIDVAIAWGPMASYFARKQRVELEVAPVRPESDDSLPLTYDICMGVRRNEDRFKAEIEQAVDRRREEIRRILQGYGVPLLPVESFERP
jgi:quinoprotein dehydrogenase-associated probable ABC transporter substrate-binding protein